MALVLKEENSHDLFRNSFLFQIGKFNWQIELGYFYFEIGFIQLRFISVSKIKLYIYVDVCQNIGWYFFVTGF